MAGERKREQKRGRCIRGGEREEAEGEKKKWILVIKQ